MKRQQFKTECHIAQVKAKDGGEVVVEGVERGEVDYENLSQKENKREVEKLVLEYDWEGEDWQDLHKLITLFESIQFFELIKRKKRKEKQVAAKNKRQKMRE